MTGIITKPTTSAKVRKGLSTVLMTCAAISLSEITSLNTAYAQEEARQFTAQTGEIVSQALELEKAGKTHPALNLLEDIINTPDNKGSELNAYERSTIYQMMGQYNYELDNPVKAQVAFQNAIEAGGLLPKEVEETHVIIAKLMIGNGQYREGSERLEAHVNSQPKPSSEHIELLVNAWLQAEDYPRALPWAEKWFNQASPKTRKHYDRQRDDWPLARR